MTESSYAKLLQTATAHPNQSLALTFLKVGLPGKIIVGHPYSEGVRLIYGKVAEAYYDGGATNVLNLPPQLKQVLDTYGLFTSGNALQQLQQQHSIAGTRFPNCHSFRSCRRSSSRSSPSSASHRPPSRRQGTIGWPAC